MNHVIHVEKLQMMSLRITLQQICQILHLQVEHRLVEVNCHYQVVSHPPEDLIQSSEFAALIKINKSDLPTPDWVSFDVGNTLRALRNNGPTVQRRLIRKLHIRWWRASAQAMARLLERAGVPKKALEIIPDIVDTCAACRAWSQPLPQSVASVKIPGKFNDQVECDIVFIHSHAILHFDDRCTRWHAAVLIPDKSEDPTIKALHSHWT